ncbi:MAG: hypothetical protein KBD55_00105 [Candidatus Pacebacteria bacterium]|nr:hypothetical protein [Candidatus Paceibacterota bacterium]
MNNKFLNILIVLAILGGAIWLGFFNTKDSIVLNIQSFEDCANAGYPIMESHPRQCKTPDGRTYSEELPPPPITYTNTTKEYMIIDTPTSGAVTGKEFKVSGQARAFYFEGSFPVEILDKDGKRLFIGPAQALGEWMVDDLVPFEIMVKVPESYIGPATVVLHKDNPSDMRELDASVSFPITIEY